MLVIIPIWKSCRYSVSIEVCKRPGELMYPGEDTFCVCPLGKKNQNLVYMNFIKLTELFFQMFIFVVMGIAPMALYMLGKMLYY